MTREELVTSAQRLTPPTAAAAAEFSLKRAQLAELVNEEHAARPDLLKLVGTDGVLMTRDNNRNFSMFMESLFADCKAVVFVDTVLWVFRAYRSHGFATVYWPANLGTWREVMKRELSPECFDSISPFYTWLITNVPVFVALTDEAAGGKAQG